MVAVEVVVVVVLLLLLLVSLPQQLTLLDSELPGN